MTAVAPVNPSRRQLLRVAAALAGLGSLAAAPKNQRGKNGDRKNRNRRPATRKGRASELPTVKKLGADFVVVGDKHYEVNEWTEIIVNGEEATLADLAVGMQAMVTGGVRRYGDTRADTIYKASRIVARADNQLAKKAAEANKRANEREQERRKR